MPTASLSSCCGLLSLSLRVQYYVMQTDWASGSQRAAERAPRGGWMCLLSMVIHCAENARETTTATISKIVCL